ncbi:twin-arginine translocase TatA/TatE family subunit [Ruania halotolerans]|uniref:twin-arginine translocase TatA/TatE family subunit n=1 Tax=Ruania halotolerans TaxID=2897773 RepID=UPI001E64A46A|nr:twin-arginine translocase TatA/TatE family subunit [Ruania halotolerans]UFU08278.1 twin-arginine translocase TatA/TatE family subunit [Ruania halotolerans]
MLKNPVFWIVIVGLVLLLFGASRLPDIAGNVGKSLKVFKKEIKELQEDTDISVDDSTTRRSDGGASTTGTTESTGTPTSPSQTADQRRDETTTS